MYIYMYILNIIYVLPITGILSTYILMAPIGAAGAAQDRGGIRDPSTADHWCRHLAAPAY